MRKRKRKETPEQYARTALDTFLPSTDTDELYEAYLEAFYREIRRRYYDFHVEVVDHACISTPSETSEDSSE